MSISYRRRLRAFAADTQVLCILGSKGGLRSLADSLKSFGVKDSCLIYDGRYCLGFRVKTRELGAILPRVCEHSDRVCIGSDYRGIFSEHGSVIIKSGALDVLSSH